MNREARLQVLETPRLRLRPLRDGDETALVELLADPEIHRWTNSIPFPYTVEHGREFIASCARAESAGESFVWGITAKPSGDLMGTIGLHGVVHDCGRAELGYWIGKDYRSAGFASEAARRVLAWCFECAEFERIQATHLPGNDASARVMQKIGMQPEGLLRGYGFKEGQHFDVFLQAVLRSDKTWAPSGEQTVEL